MGSGSGVAASGREEGSGSPVLEACRNSGSIGIVGVVMGSARAGSSEVSTADGTEVCTLCMSVDCRESGGGRFRISAGALFDAVATVSPLLSGAMLSFGIGMVGGLIGPSVAGNRLSRRSIPGRIGTSFCGLGVFHGAYES